MDKDSIERIRMATFKVARRGYDKREVDRFLERIADWLETGGDDASRSEVVGRELERIGEQTGGILIAAHDAAEVLRAEFAGEVEEEREAARRYDSGLRAEADAYSERTHIEADSYAEETRGEADAYAARLRNEANAEVATTREDADAYAESARARADDDAAETIRAGENRSHQMLDEATRRKDAIERVIDDLAERRQAVLADMERLSSELVGSASQHRDGGGAELEPSGQTEELSALEEEEADEPEPSQAP